MDGLLTSPAKCCWCGSHLGRREDTPWVCPTPACQQRQLAWGVGLHKRGPKGKVLPEIERWLYVPTPKGVDFYEQTGKTRRMLFGGASGGAKSHTLRWGLYRDALRMPGISCLLLRRTYKDLEKHHPRAKTA